MVSAALAHRLGRWDEAMHAYEEALYAAREHGFIQYVGLASELAARFWRERQVLTISTAYAREAREAYLTLESEGAGRGATATLELPLKPESQEQPPKP